MVATDSMATAFDEEGKEHYFPIDKLFGLGSHAFIVSGGMGISVGLSEKFKEYVTRRRLVGIEAVIASAGAYLSDQVREALKSIIPGKGSQGHLDRIYFVIGGYSFQDRDEPYKLALWGSEAGQFAFQRIQIGPCLAVPRTMSGEMRLLRMCNENRSVDELFDFAAEFLQRQAKENPQIGPPFRFGRVTPAGFTKFERQQESRE
jgi:hypothetical protein